MDRSKHGSAIRLADAHYDVEPGMELIIQLLAATDEQEQDPNEPVKLLEVNRDTTTAERMAAGSGVCAFHSRR